MQNLCQKGSCGCHVTLFWNFGTNLISGERLKLETSNLAPRRTALSFNKKMQNWVKRVMWGHVTQLWNFGTPFIYRERLKLATSNFARRRRAVSSNEKNIQNWVKSGHVGSRDQILEFWDPLYLASG